MEKKINPISNLVAKGIIEEAPDMKIVTRASYIEAGYNLLDDPTNTNEAAGFMSALKNDLNNQSRIHNKKIKLTKNLAWIKLEEIAEKFSFPKESLELAKHII